MTDAILRDEPAPTYSPEYSNLLSRVRGVVQGLKDLCFAPKAPDLSIPVETPLPAIDPDIIAKIITAYNQEKKLKAGPRDGKERDYRALELRHDRLNRRLETAITAAIGPELLDEHKKLEVAFAHASANPNWAAAGTFRAMHGYLKDELGAAFEGVKKSDVRLGWALNDVIHKPVVTPTDKLHRLAVDFSLFAAHSTAARCYNHWRNEGAEYRQRHMAETAPVLGAK